MVRKISVVIEQDQDGCYAWCPELKGCQAEGATVEEALKNIREAAELYLETLTRCVPTHPGTPRMVIGQ